MTRAPARASRRACTVAGLALPVLAPPCSPCAVLPSPVLPCTALALHRARPAPPLRAGLRALHQHVARQEQAVPEGRLAAPRRGRRAEAAGAQRPGRCASRRSNLGARTPPRARTPPCGSKAVLGVQSRQPEARAAAAAAAYGAPRARGRVDTGGAPIVAAVGPLQFEVVQSRMLSEYGVEVRLETLPYTCARWAMAGWDEVEAAEKDNQASPAAPAPPPGPPAPRTLRLMVARLAAMLAAERGVLLHSCAPCGSCTVSCSWRTRTAGRCCSSTPTGR